MGLDLVSTGQEFEPSAAAWNAFVEAARDHQARQRGTRRGERPPGDDGSVILVRNATGIGRARLDVVGLTSNVPPEGGTTWNMDRVVVNSVTPTTLEHFSNFAVLLYSAQPNEVVPGRISGACPVRLRIAHAQHLFADVDDGDANQLRSCHAGSAKILCRAAGSVGQVVLAYVRLGQPVANPPLWVEIVDHSGSAPPWTYTWTAKRDDGTDEPGVGSGALGPLTNRLEIAELLDPDGSAAANNLEWLPIPNGARVQAEYSALIGGYVCHVPVRHKWGPCAS